VNCCFSFVNYPLQYFHRGEHSPADDYLLG